MASPYIIISNPLRFFSVIIHSPNTFCRLSFVIHMASPFITTSNPLCFFSVIIHSPNTFCFFCKQKAESAWLIVYNKREKFFSNFSLNLNLNYSASAFSTSTIAVFCIGILQFLLLPNSTITISS